MDALTYRLPSPLSPADRRRALVGIEGRPFCEILEVVHDAGAFPAGRREGVVRDLLGHTGFHSCVDDLTILRPARRYRNPSKIVRHCFHGSSGWVSAAARCTAVAARRGFFAGVLLFLHSRLSLSAVTIASTSAVTRARSPHRYPMIPFSPWAIRYRCQSLPMQSSGARTASIDTSR